MVAGMVFGWATNTTFLSVNPPSTVPWGQSIVVQASVASLNPGLLNITDGILKVYLNDITAQTIPVIGKAASTTRL